MLFAAAFSLGLMSGRGEAFSLVQNTLWSGNDGPVCDDGFSEASAKVVCDSMGYGWGDVYFRTHVWPPTSLLEIGGSTVWSIFSYALDDVECPSWASSLDDCSWSFSTNCRRDEPEAIRLYCGNDHFSLDSNNILHWGDKLVCDDGFDSYAGQVACNEMGEVGRYRTHQTAQAKPDKQYAINNLNCPSGASGLGQCTLNVLPRGICGDREAVRLFCDAPVNCDSEWGTWSACSVTCGGGTQTRELNIHTYPTPDGVQCPTGPMVQDCNTTDCQYYNDCTDVINAAICRDRDECAYKPKRDKCTWAPGFNPVPAPKTKPCRKIKVIAECNERTDCALKGRKCRSSRPSCGKLGQTECEAQAGCTSKTNKRGVFKKCLNA